MSKSELDVDENKSGGSGAGEGAFTPTPNETAQLKEKLEKEVRHELEKIKNLDRAVDSIEFSDRIEKATERILKEFGVEDVIVEYVFDPYPLMRNYVRIVKGEELNVLWYKEESLDIVQVLRSVTYDEIAVIAIRYIADVLEVGSKYYIKIKEVNEIMVGVGE
jgi:hypothetical protein